MYSPASRRDVYPTEGKRPSIAYTESSVEIGHFSEETGNPVSMACEAGSFVSDGTNISTEPYAGKVNI